jgi:uncharacterized protein YndB with AHSA1/START domain
MSAKNSAALAAAMPSDREIVFTRVFDATRELVWKAWTDPEHVKQWWGPKGFSTTTEIMDVRVGGIWKHVMHGPDGAHYANLKVYKEVVKPEKLVYSHGGQGEGKPTVDFLSTITFEAQGNKTKLTMRMFFPSAEARDVVIRTYHPVEGGNQTLDRLQEFLTTREVQGGASGPARDRKTLLIAEPDKPMTILMRVFNAPRSLVFEAYTRAEHIEKWWGRRQMKTVVDKLDAKPGGAWRFVQYEPGGEEFAFRGEFREIVPQEKIVSTFEYEGMPGHVIVNTTLFEEHQGKTKVTVTSVYPSLGDREGMLRAGMEIGANEAWEHLEELLTQMRGA